MNNDVKRQAIDLTVTITIFTVARIVGKMVMDASGGSWIGFNGPALGILAVGEGCWWKIRNHIIEKMGHNSDSKTMG